MESIECLPISLHGSVERGNRIGRTINMPTANIVPKEDISMLPYGVYYSLVETERGSYKGITNVGTKPTIQDEQKVNVETFIYDFEGELYDESIVVTLLKFRRPEQKFNSIEELSNQMHLDLEAGRTFEPYN